MGRYLEDLGYNQLLDKYKDLKIKYEKLKGDFVGAQEDLVSKNRELKNILEDVFGAADNAINIIRFITYVASVLGSWFYMENKPLAIGIASSLTIAHLLIVLQDYIKDKKRKVKDS